MSGTISFKLILALIVLILISAPAVSPARVNSLIGGVSVGLDYDKRKSDFFSNDDYQRLVFTPSIKFKSLSEKDSLELSAAPSLRYDLRGSNTDWDSNLDVAVNRFVFKSWQLGMSDNFLKSDYTNTNNGVLIDPSLPQNEVAPTTEPQLSNNRGRQRYWLNTLDLFSNYFYREGSLLRLDFNYAALKNDTTSVGSSNQDYDRYTTGLRDEHRFNAIWGSTLDLSLVRGVFKPTNSSAGSTPTQDQLSDDLKEYHLMLELGNHSIEHNPLSVNYNYIGTRFDEALRDDSDIHQMRVNWRREYSPHLYTILGVGPSYEKTEGHGGSWTGNGSAEVNYSIEHGFFNFLVEKRRDVDNFSGSNDSGSLDLWQTRLSGTKQLLQYITLSGSLSYFSEDQQGLSAVQGNGVTQLTTIHRNIYIADAILSYTFWQYYSAGVNYTYTKQDSESFGDSYDEHRVLLTLSWQNELLHW